MTSTAPVRDPLQKLKDILNYMLDSREEDCGVREITRALDLVPSSVHRTLSVMEEHGFVEVDGSTGRYRLGLEFYLMSWRATANFPFRRVALPLMRELGAACKEAVLLGIYSPSQMKMMLVAQVESEHSLRYVPELDKWVPLHAGARGLGIMAFLPEEEQRAIIQRNELSAYTERTITDPQTLMSELRRWKNLGYVLTRGHVVPGALGLSAPIWGPGHQVMGDVLLTIPDNRFDERNERELVRLLLKCANGISARLGGVPPSAVPGADSIGGG